MPTFSLQHLENARVAGVSPMQLRHIQLAVLKMAVATIQQVLKPENTAKDACDVIGEVVVEFEREAQPGLIH